MKMINRLLKALSDINAQTKWYGWSMPGYPNNHLGSFCSYNAFLDGFQIVITHHCYPKKTFPKGPPGHIMSRRLVSSEARDWIEVTVLDHTTRFGRKKILNRDVVERGMQEFKELLRAFKKIQSTAKMFRPGPEDRLSAERSFIGFCEAVSNPRE